MPIVDYQFTCRTINWKFKDNYRNLELLQAILKQIRNHLTKTYKGAGLVQLMVVILVTPVVCFYHKENNFDYWSFILVLTMARKILSKFTFSAYYKSSFSASL